MNEAEQVHGEFYIPTFTEMKDSSTSENKQQICETSHSLESHFDSAFHATPEQVCPTVKIHPCEQSVFVGGAEDELNSMPFRTRSHSMPMLKEQQVALALRRISDDFNSVYDFTSVRIFSLIVIVIIFIWLLLSNFVGCKIVLFIKLYLSLSGLAEGPSFRWHKMKLDGKKFNDG